MATSPGVKQTQDNAADSPTTSESGSSSTSEEERLRKLFLSCDADGDGLLDRNDFTYMCRQLNMEESTSEIMQQLGMEPEAQISFQDFIRCRAQVMREEDQPPLFIADDTGIESDITKHATNVTSWPTMSSDSLGAVSGRPDSLDYDSGARDLQSPDPPVSLQKALQAHDLQAVRHLQESCSEAADVLELADRLHQAAQTSLKGEIIELRSRLQHSNLERDKLEKQIGKFHTEQIQLQEDFEDRIEELTFRYEERITELHSVIAELRKKIERHQINVIREEDEEEVDPAVSTKSQDGGSFNDNTVGSQTQTQGASDGGDRDLNSELSRVVTELESAIHERRKSTQNVDNASEEVLGGEDDSVEEKALEICKKMGDFNFEGQPPETPPRGLRPATFHPPPPPPPNEFPDPAYLQEEITALRTENSTLQEQILKQEQELQRHRLALSNITEERNRLKKQAHDQQGRHYSLEGSGSPHNSRTSTPTKSQHLAAQAAERGTPATAGEQFPVAKVAELKKLKTVSSERQVLGSEISCMGMPTTKVAEHLVQGLWKGSKLQEIIQSMDQCGSSLFDSKLPEIEIEFERLQSQIDNLRAQGDVVNLTLEESKAQCDRLSVLIGKYESNVTALQIALNYCDQCVELYEVLCALLESEQGLVIANCRATGTIGGERFSEDQEEIHSILQRAHHSRRAAENVAKHMLHKLDKSFGIVSGRSSPVKPWEDLSSSRTGSSSTSSTGDTDFTQTDERRLRDYIHQLKAERTSVNMTVVELESIHTDPIGDKVCRNPEAQRLDLENAVIIQELMAMKEEKADLKAQNYLLEKEKRALELKLTGMESQEQAYVVQIDHLKSEVMEQEEKHYRGGQDEADTSTPAITLAELRSHDPSEVGHDLAESLKREKKLKGRVQELVSALEKLSRNSEIRHQQSAEFINDLKRANSALISAFDKAKKKYQSKLKKLESQMQSLTERYETQIRMLKQRITRKEEEKTRTLNETSL